MQNEKSEAVAAYVAEVARLAKTGATTEHSFRPALSDLLSALIPGLTPVNEAKRMECGAPDFILIDKNKLPVMFVETKDLGDSDLDGRKRTGNKEQFDRYKAALDTIVFTDFLDFHFYRHNGQSAGDVRIAEWDGSKVSAKSENFAAFIDMMDEAASGTPQKIESAKRLAELMAGKARMLQRVAEAYLKPVADAYDSAPAGSKPNPTPLLDMMLGFRNVLMPNVGPSEFSDIFAQTLTYGMFAARLNDPTPEDFSRYEAMGRIPNSNPFLKQLFQYVANNLEDELEWIVDDLADLFKAVDVSKVMKGYGKSTGASDPMVHFYEDFLREYDAGLRKDRGVWYTPIQVVRFIVSAVDWALKTRFDLEDGLADSSTTQIEVEEATTHGKKLAHKVKKTVHRVQVLDPATGTGTFLAETVRQIRAKFDGNEGRWPAYVASNLLPRLNGFELLMASYTMAHVKLDYALRASGVTPSGKDRFRVFLTDSLTDWHKELPGGLFASALAAEQQGADEVKRDIPVMVVMGNPPYNSSSSNKSKWIQNLVVDYKENLNERNIQPLNDDYIKFIRLGQHYVEKNGSGIIAFITNNSFVDGLIHRQMRRALLESFDEIYILNLHGNSRINEISPDGKDDENVFAIQPGVAISILVKKPSVNNQNTAHVYYADLWGKKKDKLMVLESATMESVSWQEIQTTAPMYFFAPKNNSDEVEWNKCLRIAELISFQSSGVKTHNDNALVSYSHFTTPFNRPYLYRPFDVRWIDYDLKKVVRHRYKGMRHMLQPNIALVLGRQGQVIGGCEWNLAFITQNISDTNIFYRGGGIVFPLYLYEENMGRIEKRANMDSAIVAKIGAAIGGEATPEDIFAYIYGILHTPSYRKKFKEFLKTDFPRIPYPKDAAQFKTVAEVGRSLIDTHLMRDAAPGLSETRARFPKMGSDIVEEVRFDDGRVFINAEQFFDNVPQIAWEMPIGGYRPAEKWLKDRKGRALTGDDIKHYQRIIIALMKTAEAAERLETVVREESCGEKA